MPLIPSSKGPDDKRKKRRESHNAVERRRRDNINDRISDLAYLIPDILLDPSTLQARNQGEADDSSNNGLNSNGIPQHSFTAAQLAQQQASNRPNKGVILAKSVEYIRYLQQYIQLQADRTRELEAKIRFLEGGNQQQLQGLQLLLQQQQSQQQAQSNKQTQYAGMNIPMESPMAGVQPLPTLQESETFIEESTGLSHRRDQFTAQRPPPRHSMSADHVNGVSGVLNQPGNALFGSASLQQAVQLLQQRQGFPTDLNNAFDPNRLPSNQAINSIHASTRMGDGSELQNQSALTVEDLLDVRRYTSMLDDTMRADSNSPRAHQVHNNKMQEDEDNANALGMRI